MSVTYLGGPCIHQTRRVRPCTHIAPRRAPAHPLNRLLFSWIALPNLGWLQSIWAGQTELNFMRIKPGHLSQVQVSTTRPSVSFLKC